MALRCFHFQKIDPQADCIQLCEHQKHHLLKVLRAKKEELLEVLDGHGGILRGRIASTNIKEPLYVFKESFYQAKPVSAQIILVQALPTGPAFESILKYGTSLGVSIFQPIITERSQCAYSMFAKASKAERFKTIMVEACKQSGNPYLPVLAPPRHLADWLPCMPACTYLASLEATAQPLPALDKSIKQVAAIVGPEGDFSTHEYSLLKQANVKPIHLNPYILRSEVAALALLAQIQRALV